MKQRKLRPGDNVRVIAPAASLAVVQPETRKIANRHLAQLGLSISYSKHSEKYDEFSSTPVKARVKDLHQAFEDPNVNAVVTAIGGYTSNHLLQYIDYELLTSSPKIFCGYSDITVLLLAIYAKTGMITYCGPHYSTFGMEQGIEYTSAYFQKCVMDDPEFEVLPSPVWSDDMWYLDQENRVFVDNKGWKVVNEGEARGTLLGGNLGALNLLHGTEYMPSLVGSLLLVEDNHESKPRIFDRDLQSLIHQPGFDQVKGLLIGRFQNASNMNDKTLVKIVRSKKELADIPVAMNLNFGHTTPQFTFPIGGEGTLVAHSGSVRFFIKRH